MNQEQSDSQKDLERQLSQMEKTVAEKEEAERQKETAKANERKDTVRSIADMVEGNQALNKRIGNIHETFYGFRQIEAREKDRVKTEEEKVVDRAVAIDTMAKRIKALEGKGVDVSGLDDGLEEMKNSFKGQEAELARRKEELKELARLHQGFQAAQKDAAAYAVDHAIDTVLGGKELAKNPETKEFTRLKGEERERLKKEIEQEFERRAEEKQEALYVERDKERVKENRKILEEVKAEFEKLKRYIRKELKNIENDLGDEDSDIQMEAKVQKEEIEKRLKTNYWTQGGRNKAAEEVLQILETIEVDKKSFNERISRATNLARAPMYDLIKGLHREEGKPRSLEQIFLHASSKNQEMREEMDAIKADKILLEQEITDFKKNFLYGPQGDEQGSEDSRLRNKVAKIFLSRDEIEKIKDRVREVLYRR